MKLNKTILEVNLDAVAENLQYFRQKLHDGVQMIAMVKALGYGGGSVPLSLYLEKNRLVDYLAVANFDEGVELRCEGIRLPIMIMVPQEDTFSLLVEHHLEPALYSIEIVKKFVRFVAQKGLKNYPIHLKVDSGMHRLGLENDVEVKELAEYLREQTEVEVISFFSHLCCADEPVQDDFTRAQIEKFKDRAEQFQQYYGQSVKRHILNSAGIERFAEHQMEVVRLGIGMYGVSCLPDITLSCVNTLHTTITQIHTLQKGESIGYSRSYVMPKEGQIAVLPIGYADGLMRCLGNEKLTIYCQGKYVPIVGNICMDMCMIDITNCPVKVGDRVVLFGEENSVEKVAKVAQTISYEIFTALSPRVKREYYADRKSVY